jgi:hypothetical protein
LANMQRRTWISWVVVAAVLMHAVLLAQHDVFRFKAALRSDDALAVNIEDFPPEAICHTQTGATETGKPRSPPSAPGKFPSTCPVCLAFVAAYAVSPGTLPPPRPPQASVYAAFLPPQSPRPDLRKFRSPPNRGPPASI